MQSARALNGGDISMIKNNKKANYIIDNKDPNLVTKSF